MPYTPRAIAPGMKVTLDNPHRCPIFGETLTGFVTYKPSFKPVKYTEVLILLRGRVKTNILEKSGNFRESYKGRESLFVVSKRLYYGEEKETNGEDVWPFSIDIPSEPTIAGANKEAVLTKKLPPFFYLNPKSSMGWMADKKYHAFVEYILTVDISNKTEPKKHVVTTIPLPIRPPSTAQPISDMKLYARRTPVDIKTTMLLPETDQPSGTFGKMRYLFKSSSVPNYAFDVQVEFPTLIQLDHADALPFRVFLVEDARTKSQTKLAPGTTAPPVKITSVSLTLQSHTFVKGEGSMFGTSEVTKKDSYQLASCTYSRTLNEFPAIPVIDKSGFTFDESNTITSRYNDRLVKSAPPEFIDIGSLLSIRLSRAHFTYKYYPSSKIMQRKIGTPLTPSFKTKYMEVSYYLKWNIAIECAGEKKDIEGKSLCTVLGPSEILVKQKYDAAAAAAATAAGLGLVDEESLGFTEITEMMAEGMGVASDVLEFLQAIFGA